MNEQQFPFAAVTGQQNLKLALMLAAVNPAIGGVLVSGPRGCAKSTLARGLVDILPHRETDDATAPFVTLPLGASEEMLLGSLDLQQVLNDKQVSFRPGLLSKAHQGVLYVDEVNLLNDHLVDQLLDVAASGVNRIERDGISHQHAASFLLLGTMNPDEGALRPQLQDRFGLAVNLSNQYPVAERVEIVRHREAFDADPEGFCEQYRGTQASLLAQIVTARQILTNVTCSDELRIVIAEACNAAGVDGLRGDIVWFRAAVAHAALQGRNAVIREDIDAVAELVLAHRRKDDGGHNSNPPPAEQNSDQQPKLPPKPPRNNGFKRPDDSQRQSAEQSSQQDQQSQSDKDQQGDWGSMAPQAYAADQQIDVALPAQLEQAVPLKGNTLAAPSASRQGNAAAHSGAARGNTKTNRPDWFATLGKSLGEWPPQLVFKRQPEGRSQLHCLLLDTSASTLAEGVFARAKGAMVEIARRAYLERQQLAIFGFGNNRVENLLPQIRAPKELQRWLENLSAGGGTPMRQVFSHVAGYLQQVQRQFPALEIHTYVLTDGRSQAQLNDISLPGKTFWLDTEQASVKRGRGEALAQQLHAEYIAL
ncbi:ATP-binding protein [Aliamphritea spongicola]|uniref:ATP-binding protein n=1 Tax=Aliamphritea spongicola TaxID=707589 RepID=UPI00196A52C3|nr:ATP-binding protein [Aliamphritea spongicola]MBN3561700.1 ATP-binding protein [Aliamphritea spongicola]